MTLFRFDSLNWLQVFHINLFFRLFRPKNIENIIIKDEFEIFVSRLIYMIGESTHSRQRATCVISSTVPARSINTEQIISFNTKGYEESSRSLRRSCRFNFDLGRLSPRRCNLGGRERAPGIHLKWPSYIPIQDTLAEIPFSLDSSLLNRYCSEFCLSSIKLTVFHI